MLTSLACFGIYATVTVGTIWFFSKLGFRHKNNRSEYIKEENKMLDLGIRCSSLIGSDLIKFIFDPFTRGPAVQ